VLDRFSLKFQPLTEVKWIVYRFKSPLLMLNRIFRKGSRSFHLSGRNVLPADRQDHGHSTDRLDQNAFGRLLKEVRHYAHKHIHEVLVDLVMMQKELHPAVFTVMDGSVAGDGAGPRTWSRWSRTRCWPRPIRSPSTRWRRS
jgi:hypothetical protein